LGLNDPSTSRIRHFLPMRVTAETTAVLLRSVSARYRYPLAAAASAARIPTELQIWQLASHTHGQVESEDSATAVRDHRIQRLEAVLFLAREPLTTRKLSQYANLSDATEARTLVNRLNELYDQESRAFRVERVAGGFQLMTRREFANWVRRLEHVPREMRLSAPAMETLAVVAYRQPVLRADIEAIRGVSCGEILRQLMERDLVRIGGRSEELGRPYLYTTTKDFLRVFGLDSIDSLPRVETISETEDGGEASMEPDETITAKQPGVESVSNEEESGMPVLTLSGLDLQGVHPQEIETELGVSTPVTSQDEAEDDEYFDEAEDDDDFDDDEDDLEDDLDDEDEDEDDEFEDDEFDDDEEDEVDDDEELEDEWEEVEEDDEDNLDEEDSDWGYDEEDEEDEDWD
jgi:segregation and condensation protein B